MAESIEAAFDKALLHGGHETYPCCSETARALAMSVHEETLDLLEQVLDDPKYNSALAVARYVLSGVQEQIEALGKEAE